MVCAEDVRRGKPDPEPYLRAAALLGAAPGQCLALEDSPTGVAAAEAAGCRVVAVPTLRAIEPRPGRLVGRSLRDIDLGWLRAAWAGRPELAALLAGRRGAGGRFRDGQLTGVRVHLGSGKWHAAMCPCR